MPFRRPIVVGCADCGGFYMPGFNHHYCSARTHSWATWTLPPEAPIARGVPCATCARQPRFCDSLDCDDCNARHTAQEA